MCDAFLVLAYTEGMGISCFLVPRWRPDGTRNHLFIQRLKDKLGNRSNASTEMEFQDTHGVMVGDEGRGIRTIMDMVTGNRLYCAMSSAGIMRQALVQALHHTAHRSAFQKRLIHQPLMRNVLADMAVEVEAALALGLRIARAMDHADDDAEGALARIGTAVAKYWNCKRCPSLVVEALECHGGPGYIEESIMPRLYREAPLKLDLGRLGQHHGSRRAARDGARARVRARPGGGGGTGARERSGPRSGDRRAEGGAWRARVARRAACA